MARGAAANKTAKPFAGISGDMAARIGAQDWASTPLGPIEGWSPALLGTLRLILPARAEIVLFWGPDYRAFYNDAYAPTIGDKHPRALGQPARENWAELWSDLEPLLDGVFRAGETFAAKDRPFYIERHGFGETVYFDVSYSAVREADDRIGGVLCIVAETTERVRANAALRRSEERLRLATESADVGLWDIDVDENISFFYARDAFSMPQDRKTSFEEFLSHVHPEDAAALRTGYAAARD